MDIRSIVFDLVGCRYTGPVEEVEWDGVYVKRSKERMIVGGSTIPEKCRAYMLLAKGLAEGKEEFELEQKPVFSTLGPMLDMSRGGVMKVESVKKYLRYMAVHGMNMLMLYTEDTYEVPEYPYMGYQRGRYTLEELRQVDDYAASLGIEVIPCIQTLGHMEQFLRYSVHSKMKDTKRVLMVGEEETYKFIDACIAVMRKAFRSKRIHIGCDETNGMGSGNYLIRNGYRDRLELFTEHVGRVSEICKKYDFRPMIWSDMYFVYTAKGNGGPDYDGAVIPPSLLKIMPDVDLMYWQYGDLGYDKYKSAIDRHRMLKGETMFAGAIWTYEGILPNYKLTYEAMMPALQACVDGGVSTVVATLWSNDGCETSHMLGIPQLSLFSEYCYRGLNCTEDDIWDVAGFVTGITKELADAVSEFFFGYEGAVSAGKAIMWSDPLINLLSYDYDLELAEECLVRGLEVFKKYEGVEYFIHVFCATLDKCRLQMQLRPHYKAGDREWLTDFAERTLPEVIEDFEKLYLTHREMWCKDYKGNGLERIMMRYAGTLERLRYTKLRIEQYLAGEIEEIEELEPETIQMVKDKFMDARDFMLTTTYF